MMYTYKKPTNHKQHCVKCFQSIFKDEQIIQLYADRGCSQYYHPNCFKLEVEKLLGEN